MTADLIEKELEKCERWINILSQIANWLVVQKAESGKDHADEVANFSTALAKSNDNFLKLMHIHTQGQLIGNVGEPQRPSAPAKPISEFRPKELEYYATPFSV